MEEINPRLIDFEASYPDDTDVKIGEMTLKLHQARDLEKMMCRADPEKRLDPERRIVYLATMLAAAGSLLPEHAHLVQLAGPA